MKRILIIFICMAFCLAACTIPAPAEQPTAAPTEEAQKPTEAPEKPTEVPQEPTQAPASAPEAPEEPEASAPEADLVFHTTTLSGEEITSDIIKDYDLVIVNFWAEWCGPCVGELPALEKIRQAYPNVLILGAWLGDVEDEALATLERAKVSYPCVYVEGKLVDYAGRSMYIPATYFFDKNGSEIGEPVIGSMSFDEWKAAVEGFLS